MPELSPLAQQNLAAIEKLLALIQEGCDVLKADMLDPENRDETALTGPEFLNFLKLLHGCFLHWDREALMILSQQPEFVAMKAMKESLTRAAAPSENPGLTD